MIDQLKSKFEEIKGKLNPLLKRNRWFTYIFQVTTQEEANNRHFIGDGFGYGGEGKIYWRYGMSGHDEPATPENLLDSYRHYVSKDMTMEDALKTATGVLESKLSSLSELEAKKLKA